MNINSRRREQNLTNDADRSMDRSYGSHHSLSRTRRVSRFPPLLLLSIQMNCLALKLAVAESRHWEFDEWVETKIQLDYFTRILPFLLEALEINDS